LTPVTPETFAKWKKDRLDKKAAEEQARRAKEATGRALFESGSWKMDDESDEEDDDDIWNLEKLRQETEVLRQKTENERLATRQQEPTADDPGTSEIIEAAPDT